MESIADVVSGREIAVVEDAAQAQGAERHGVRAGGFGLVAGTSFYPGKNLGAWGDAGAVLTSSDRVADQLRCLRNHGGQNRYEHRWIGTNSRLDTLQAVVLRAKLGRLDGWNHLRRQAAARYGELLGDLEQVTLPSVAPGGLPVWHLYVVQVADRDRVLKSLRAASIGAGIHYPSPIHQLPGWQHLGLGRRSGFPAAEGAAERILSLPLYPGITAAQQERVAEALREAL
jgi:dTDP-4-amino-4,6-dideoxygalactose transaminase